MTIDFANSQPTGEAYLVFPSFSWPNDPLLDPYVGKEEVDVEGNLVTTVFLQGNASDTAHCGTGCCN